MITLEDQKRIKGDVDIAINALNGLKYAALLHESYVAEKTRTVERCLAFIKQFAEEEKHG